MRALAFILLACAVATGQTTRPSPLDGPLAQMKSPDWVEAWAAIDALGKLKSTDAIAPLGAMMQDPKAPAFLRAKALVALAKIEGDKVLKNAINFAQSENPVWRASAAEALGLSGAEAAKPVVAQLLTDKEGAVRNAALIADARLNGAGAMPRILAGLKSWDQGPSATRALLYVKTPEARQELLAAVENKDPRIRVAAIHALAEVGDEKAILAIVSKLSGDKEKGVHLAARAALAAFRPEQLSKPLLDAFGGNDPSLYAASLSLLANSPNKEIAQNVASRMEVLQKQAPDAVAPALRLLANADADAYVKVFAKYVGDDNASVRRSAIEGLGKSQGKGVDLFGVLRDRLVDEDKTVRAAAYQTIRRAARGTPPGGIVAYLAKPLASTEKAIYQPALELLRDRLGRVEVPAALVALDHFLAGKDAAARKLAAAIIEAYADPAGMETLARAQGFPSPWAIIGPFTAGQDNAQEAIDAAFPPEQEIDLKKSYDTADGQKVGWSLLQANRADGVVDFGFIYQREGQDESAKTGRVAYAAVQVVSKNECDAELGVVARGQLALWLNAQKMPVQAQEKEQSRLPVHLKAGPNLLLVKCASAGGREWQFQLQLLSKEGVRLDGVSYLLPQ